MFGPQHIYWAVVILVALPIAVIGGGRVARSIVAVWAAAMVLVGIFGLPNFWAYLPLHLGGFCWCYVKARSRDARAIGALFLPLGLLDIWGITGAGQQAWWGVFWVALGQVLLLPLIADWGRIRKATRTIVDTLRSDHLERRRHV